MFDVYNSEILSRIQFAFTIGFHIIWPTINIGLGLFLLIMETSWLRTGNKVYLSLYKFWVKIFALVFGIGVVTGIPLSFQFGTNFSKFSELAGGVIGPLMGVEVMTAFFLEAAFIGVMIFGWKRFPPKVHLMATVLVVMGTHHSAFWILSLNSWMQTPAGVSMIGDQLKIDDWFEIIFNPSFPYRFVHMILACYVTVSLVLSGISAYYLLKKKNLPIAEKGFSLGLWVLLITMPLQMLAGDQHGLNTLQHQPAKVAAMEGVWNTSRGVPALLFAVPDQELEKNTYEIAIPKLASLILTHNLDGEVKGLKEWKKSDRPKVALVFYAFRVMVGLGVIFLLVALTGLVLRLSKKLYSVKPFLYLCLFLTPMGIVSTISGWIVTEVGRQPWVIYGMLRTADAASPLQPETVLGSLLAFIVVYPIILFSFLFYGAHVVKKGPMTIEEVMGDISKDEQKWMPVLSHSSHITK